MLNRASYRYSFVSVLASILFIYFSFELCFAKTVNFLHIGLQHSFTEVVSYDVCTSTSEDRRTDRQGHPSRPSGLKLCILDQKVYWDGLVRLSVCLQSRYVQR